MPDLVEFLRQETGREWEWHRSRDAAVLFCGRSIPNGPEPILSHAVIVFGGQEAEWHVDVIRRGGDAQTPKALRVPGSMSWFAMLEFVELLVDELGTPPPA